MKKKIILFILLILLTGCAKELKEEKSVLETMGYTKDEIATINNYQDCISAASKKYDKNIALLMKEETFSCQNLNDYLNYLNNYESSIKDTIVIVNHGIKDYYNQNLASLFTKEYYIEKNLDRYVSYLKKYEKLELDAIITSVNTNLDYEYYTNTKTTDMSKDTLILVNKYNYLDKDYVPSDLRLVKESCRKSANGSLRSIAADAFEELCDAALLDGYVIRNGSAYRSYNTQLSLYNDYVARDGVKEADTYSARAGYSEHQTGLALDVNMIKSDFQYTEEYKWLQDNAYKYGFIERYPKGKEAITGYMFESWHYRYVGKDIAEYIHNHDITFDEYYAVFIEKN